MAAMLFTFTKIKHVCIIHSHLTVVLHTNTCYSGIDLNSKKVNSIFKNTRTSGNNTEKKLTINKC